MYKEMDRKDVVRNQIVLAAKNYSEQLSSQIFLYVFGNQYIEVMFRTSDFLHLTGIGTKLYSKKFFMLAKQGKIVNDQLFFAPKYPFKAVMKKLECLVRLPELTTEDVIILLDMQTETVTYKIGLSNLEFSIGMYEKDGFYSPQSLRGKGKPIENSLGGEVVDFIFARENGEHKYTRCTFQDPAKEIPAAVLPLLDPALMAPLSPAPPPSDPQPKIP